MAERAGGRYGEWRSAVGEEVLRDVEKQITLYHIDACWAEHLARVADVRETIHLTALANQDPLDEFHKTIGREFLDLQERIDRRIVDTFLSAEISPDGVDLDEIGLRRPGATWTLQATRRPVARENPSAMATTTDSCMPMM